MKHISAALAGLLLCALPALAIAQGWPSKPIRLVVPYGPGGPTDIVGRVLAPKLQEALGQPVVVENRLGAGGIVGTEAVARSPGDGYTVMFSASGAMVITPHLNPKLPYETFRDFAPVALGATAPMILLTSAPSTLRSVQDLIAQAKARPGTINYSTAGIGTPPHLAAELMRAAAGIDIVHVAYKAGPQAEAALVSGEVGIMFGQPSSLSLVRAGKLRALAVSTAKRSGLAPELPTMAESGLPGFDVVPWYGALVPAKTPEDIVNRLNAEFLKAQAQKDVVQRLQSLGFEPPAPHTAAEFLAFMRNESAKWQKVIKDANITLD